MNTFRELVYSSFTLSTDIEKVNLVVDYVINNVSFNYAELLKGLLFDSLDNYYDMFNVSSKEEAKRVLKGVLESISIEIFSNEELKNKTINQIMDAIDKVELQDNIYKMLGKATDDINDTTYAEDNRLLKKGVCDDISNFLHDYFNLVGIKSEIVIGQGHSSHKWIIVYIDNMPYHMDLTDSIYVRDGSYHMNNNISDFYYMSLEDLFRLDPNRQIRIIGTTIYDPSITKDNYSNIMIDGGNARV